MQGQRSGSLIFFPFAWQCCQFLMGWHSMLIKKQQTSSAIDRTLERWLSYTFKYVVLSRGHYLLAARAALRQQSQEAGPLFFLSRLPSWFWMSRWFGSMECFLLSLAASLQRWAWPSSYGSNSGALYSGGLPSLLQHTIRWFRLRWQVIKQSPSPLIHTSFINSHQSYHKWILQIMNEQGSRFPEPFILACHCA